MKVLPVLTIQEVKARTKEPGSDCFVGGVRGLHLRKNNNDASRGLWLLRYKKPSNGRDTNTRVGIFPDMTLQQARTRGAELRALVDQGTDPAEERRKAKKEAEAAEAKRTAITFGDVAREWLECDGVRLFANGEDPARRLRSEELRLKKHIPDALMLIPFEDVTPADITRCLHLSADHPATCKKIWSAIKKICTYGMLRGYRDPDPAATIVFRLPIATKTAEGGNYAACPVDRIPELVSEIKDAAKTSDAARACLFAILTAGRSKPVRLARWCDIDLEKGIWTIPPESNKVKDLNAIRTAPLSSYAVSFLKSLPAFSAGVASPSDYIFLSRMTGAPLKAESLERFLHHLHEKKKAIDGIGWVDTDKMGKGYKGDLIITVHGTARASFRTWTQNDTHGNLFRYHDKAAEACLLHKTAKYNGAYERAEFIEERRKIMNDWGRYCIEGKWGDE